MIVDAECGVPLDLCLWGSLWTDDGDDSGKVRVALRSIRAAARSSRDNSDLNAFRVLTEL